MVRLRVENYGKIQGTSSAGICCDRSDMMVGEGTGVQIVWIKKATCLRVSDSCQARVVGFHGVPARDRFTMEGNIMLFF